MPQILGIVNITADSFSDGGRFLKAEDAIAHALQLMADGADAIDLGAASSNPDAAPVRTDVEMERLAPVVQFLIEKDIAVSVDTFNPTVQRHFASKAAFLNDIQGFPDSSVYPELAQSRCRLVIMHSIQRQGVALRRETIPETVFEAAFRFFEQRIAQLTTAGIVRERLILDPGMGFFLGSNPETSLYMLKNLRKLRSHFRLPVLVSVSRKSFLGALIHRPPSERGASTIAAELFAARQGVEWIRTHDVRSIKDALRVQEALLE